ncbi:ABC transporter ATP-binding protein [Lysinimonas soli]|uniref:ABC transporter ATP-binding protein n=1 Tax=Lysinimonas soli TaxID=1074233 RepID=A0ABW0NQY2_9MICO
MSAVSSPLLQVRGATVAFGGVLAVNDVSLDVMRGEILGIVGPNGAGKSTLFGAIAGGVPLKSGTIELNGEDVSGRRASYMSHRGVARTFQKVRLFASMTAEENVLVAARAHERSSAGANERAAEALDRIGFLANRRVPVSGLSLADRKRIEIARGLAAKPTLLLLDEMMNGLTVEETDALIEAIRSLPSEGLTIMLVEHVLQVVRSLCDRLAVLHHGQLLVEGDPAHVLSRPDVAEAWLGRATGQEGHE